MAIVTRIPCTGQAVNQDHWNRRTGHRPITAVLSESRYHGSVTDQAHCGDSLSGDPAGVTKPQRFAAQPEDRAGGAAPPHLADGYRPRH
ncbi:hypothetical protein VTN96DRAFT_2585 [Rasamsonia emersonii]